MPAYATCPSCKARLKVPDHLAGQKRLVKCPSCAETFDVSEIDGTTAEAPPHPAKQSAGAARRAADEDDDIDERSRGRRRREDDEDDDDRPRARRRERRDDDDDDDRPARRRRRKPAKSGGSNVVLVLAIAGGVCLLILIGCGVGAFFIFRDVKSGLAGIVDNPNVTQANFDRVNPGMPLQAVEAIFGPGGVCSDDDARGVILAQGGGGMPGMGQDQYVAIANNPAAFGLTGWYRWKNGPTTMLIAVDATNQVRVAGLITVTKNSSSRSWKSNVNVGGGGMGPGRPGRGR
jgi:predicted Zn finger-like uncharacterized protein